jgi:antirestriction protein ArdC
MGAGFLCGHVGIETTTLENTASYIDGWLRVLRGDSRMVVQAAAHAQKAADFILGHASESASEMAEDEHGDAGQVA